MPEHLPDRRATLIGGAAAGDLSPEERVEYDALCAADPSAAAEAAEMRVLLDRVSELSSGWTEVVPDSALSARVLSVPGGDRPASAAPSGRSRWSLVAAGVVLVGVGGLAGAGIAGLTDSPTEGPPGTLGAVEPIDFRGEPAEVEIEAALVAHTWGTEAVLDMNGWVPGDTYRLVLVAADGETQDAGTFLGSEVAIDCHMNGALLREDVDVVEIRDDSDQVVARSDVPEVTGG